MKDKDSKLLSEAYLNEVVDGDIEYNVIYWVLGQNARGPWQLKSGEDSIGPSMNMEEYILHTFDIDTDDSEVVHRDEDSIVVNQSAELTLVISQDPEKTKALYAKYNEDTGTAWGP